jgi:hypothetical protein
VEPGGLRCSRCGYTPIFKRILPRDDWLSGRDWRNRERLRALIVTADLIYQRHVGRIIEFAARSRLPAMYQLRGHVEAGASCPTE